MGRLTAQSSIDAVALPVADWHAHFDETLGVGADGTVIDDEGWAGDAAVSAAAVVRRLPAARIQSGSSAALT